MSGTLAEPILYFIRLDSTNLYCLREAARLPAGTIVVADAQTAGRGRQGRAWQSPPGVNLYTSILLKPPYLNARVELFPPLAALAIWRAVRDHGAGDAWIKWPNDVYAGDRKLAGVLAESQVQQGQVTATVVGMGVNLNLAAEDAARIGAPATSLLLETGKRVDRARFLEVLYGYFNSYYRSAQQFGFGTLHAEWRGASRLLGRAVTLTRGDERLVGVVEDLDADGALCLRLPTGPLLRLHAGDVSLAH